MKSVLKFLPIFLLHFIFIFIVAENNYDHGDENRYFCYAHNIVNGYYTDAENPDIINGPGYPLILAPFILLHIPPLVQKLFNSVYILFSVFLFYKLLKFYIPEKRAVLMAYLLGLYPPLARVSYLVMTEPFTLFLVCGFLYYSAKFLILPESRVKKVILPAFFLGFLLLTKTIFAHVATVSVLLLLGLYVFTRQVKSLKFAMVLVGGYLLAIPFLIHNYYLTGRYFYWGNNGGTQLYWMSTHKEKEYGNWLTEDLVINHGVPGIDSSHVRFFKSMDAIPNHIERHDRVMAKAKDNIKKNPKEYLANLLPNTLRLFFDYPNSYTEHNYLKLYFYLFSNIFFIVPFIFSLYPACKNRERIPFEIIAFLLFISIYLGGSILLSADARYFLPAIPFLLLWLGYTYSNIIKISF